MAKIETRAIRCRNGKTKASRAQEAKALDQYRKREARRERAYRQLTVRSDGVTRCSKCPPLRCCPECAKLNNARQQAGLIRPRGDPRPHPNNCLIPVVHGPHKGGRPLKVANRPSEIISIDVKPLGGGWYLGMALLGLDVVYERKFRSRDDARRYAVNSMVAIREGLAFEALLSA